MKTPEGARRRVQEQLGALVAAESQGGGGGACYQGCGFCSHVLGALGRGGETQGLAVPLRMKGPGPTA